MIWGHSRTVIRSEGCAPAMDSKRPPYRSVRPTRAGPPTLAAVSIRRSWAGTKHRPRGSGRNHLPESVASSDKGTTALCFGGYKDEYKPNSGRTAGICMRLREEAPRGSPNSLPAPTPGKRTSTIAATMRNTICLGLSRLLTKNVTARG